MGILNSRNNPSNSNNNRDMVCYDINEYNDIVNNQNNFVDNFDDNNMVCMQCQNFGTPCTCLNTTEYIPTCETELFQQIPSQHPFIEEYYNSRPTSPTPQPFYIPPATTLVSTPEPLPAYQSCCTSQSNCTCDCCNLKLCDLSSSEIRILRKLFSEYSGFDRKLSFPEFLKLLRSNPNLTACCNLNVCFLKRCFEASDLNSDGLINFDQFLYAYCLAKPDSFPKNNFCCQSIQSRPCSPPHVFNEQPNQPNLVPCYDVLQPETVQCYTPSNCSETPLIECFQPKQVFDSPPCQSIIPCQSECTPEYDPCAYQPEYEPCSYQPEYDPCAYQPEYDPCAYQPQIQTCIQTSNNQIINLPPLPPEIERLLHRTPKKRTVMYPNEIYCSNDPCSSKPIIPPILPPLSPDIERLLRKSNKHKRRTNNKRYF